MQLICIIVNGCSCPSVLVMHFVTHFPKMNVCLASQDRKLEVWLKTNQLLCDFNWVALWEALEHIAKNVRKGGRIPFPQSPSTGWVMLVTKLHPKSEKSIIKISWQATENFIFKEVRFLNPSELPWILMRI